MVNSNALARLLYAEIYKFLKVQVVGSPGSCCADLEIPPEATGDKISPLRSHLDRKPRISQLD